MEEPGKEASQLTPEIAAHLYSIAAPLLTDISIALAELDDAIRKYNRDASTLVILNYKLKNAIRCLCASAEAIAYTLGDAVLAAQATLQVPQRHRNTLAESRTASANGAVVENRSPLPDRLKFALKYCGLLMGGQYGPHVGPPGFVAFRKTYKCRNAFAHASSLEALTLNASDYVTFREAASWLTFELTNLLGSSIGGKPVPRRPSPSKGSATDWPLADVSLRHSEGSQLDPRTAPRYMADFARALGSDTQLAFEEQRGSEPGSDRFSFRIRSVVRTIGSEVEGTISFCNLYLRLFGLPKITRPREEDLADTFARAVSTFSSHFGTGVDVSRRGDSWAAFRKLLLLRDRLTHPKEAADIAVGLSSLALLCDAQSWMLSNSWPALRIDPDRAYQLYLSQRAHPTPAESATYR